jgi:hypothetical protein
VTRNRHQGRQYRAPCEHRFRALQAYLSVNILSKIYFCCIKGRKWGGGGRCWKILHNKKLYQILLGCSNLGG